MDCRVSCVETEQVITSALLIDRQGEASYMIIGIRITCFSYLVIIMSRRYLIVNKDVFNCFVQNFDKC